MTDLHTLANAISDSSPNIKAFAQAVADVLEPAAPPPPPPTGAAPVWNGVIPSGQWEYAGVNKSGPPLSERVTSAATLDGIRPPAGAASLTRIIVRPGDQYQGSTGWTTRGRIPDPSNAANIKMYGPGADSAFAFALYLPVGFPGDANMWAAPVDVHQTKASYVSVTGVAPAHVIAGGSAISVDVAGGRDGARVVGVNQSVLPGYSRGVWHVFAMRYKHDPTNGAFELWHAEHGKGPLVPLIQKSGFGTMYEGTTNYFLWGVYRAQSGTATTTIYMAGGSAGAVAREYPKMQDALAFANAMTL